MGTSISRKLRAPFELLGHTVPPGASVGVAIPALHRRGELYPEPERFRPERFLERTFAPFEFAPFGGGSRRCIVQTFAHDGAAVLDQDGEIIAASEEERLNRIKHSSKFPSRAIRSCLERRGVRLRDVDRIAYYATEAFCDAMLAQIFQAHPDAAGHASARTVLSRRLGRELGQEIDPDKLVFVAHHVAHAESAFATSGFEASLILAIDGFGDLSSGLVAVPALLNTSFNNDVEPIVDSVDDAVVAALTTGLHCLVVGDHLVYPRAAPQQPRHALVPSLPGYVKVHRIHGFTGEARPGASFEIRTTYDVRLWVRISEQAAAALMQADGEQTIEELVQGAGATANGGPVVEELMELWSRRLVVMRARVRGSG